MSKRSRRRSDGEEVILRRDMLDASTCSELGGVLDEDDKCVLWKTKDPKDPDSILLKHVNYQRSPGERNRARDNYD